LKGFSELFGDETEIESLLVWMARDAPEALGERLRIAVLAAGTDLRATAQRVPRRVGPFDL
jgi:hypothetical protein